MYEPHKRVLLPQLPMEWLDVVPPTLHFRPSQEIVWILRVCIVWGEESAREQLKSKMKMWWSLNPAPSKFVYLARNLIYVVYAPVIYW